MTFLAAFFTSSVHFLPPCFLLCPLMTFFPSLLPYSFLSSFLHLLPTFMAPFLETFLCAAYTWSSLHISSPWSLWGSLFPPLLPGILPSFLQVLDSDAREHYLFVCFLSDFHHHICSSIFIVRRWAAVCVCTCSSVYAYVCARLPAVCHHLLFWLWGFDSMEELISNRKLFSADDTVSVAGRQN